MSNQEPQNISFGNQIQGDLIQTPKGNQLSPELIDRIQRIDYPIELLSLLPQLPKGNIAIGNQVGGNLIMTIDSKKS